VYAWPRYRPLAYVLIAWSMAVLMSIVYLGEHYVVDALAGYVFVALAVALVELARRWLARRAPASPPAPTPATPSA
jgi:membrane-associated phospholipid phosphatase